MGKFVYRFESIKKVKETFEKKIQKEINVIEMQIKQCLNKIESLNMEKQASIKFLSEKKNIKASELQFRNNAMELLNLEVKKINNEIHNLEQSKAKKLEELIEKSKEHKIFEKLEEKHQEDYQAEQNHIDQKTIDEIASVKFAREE